MIFKNNFIIPINKMSISIVKSIHLYGGFFRKFTKVGFFFRGVVRNVILKNTFYKKYKNKNILIRAKFRYILKDLTYFKYYSNNNLILKKRLTPLSQFIFGSTFFNIKRKKLHMSFKHIL